MKLNVILYFMLEAGWIGNDTVSPIVGEHDPYYQFSGRVSGYYQ